MKKILSLILVLAVALNVLSVGASALSISVPEPTIYLDGYDGYTLVWFDAPAGVTLRYTVRDDSYKRIKDGSKLKIKESCYIKIKATKSGYTPAYYSYYVRVIGTDFRSSVNAYYTQKYVSDTKVDSYVQSAALKATNWDMSTFLKIQACYNWIVNNIEYSSEGIVVSTGKNFSQYMKHKSDYLLIEQSQYAFENKKGVHDNISAVFMMLCRYVGVDSYIATGSYKTKSGKYKDHSWVVIQCDDLIFQFDPTLEIINKLNNPNAENKYFALPDDYSLYEHRNIIDFYYFEPSNTSNVKSSAVESVNETDDTSAASEKPFLNVGGGSFSNDEKIYETLLNLVNQAREEAGVKKLYYSSKVQEVCKIRTDEISYYYSHTRPTGSRFCTAYRDAGIKYKKSGENIAYGLNMFDTPEEVFQAWMDSETHKENILNPNFECCAFGLSIVKVGSDTYYYWTQEFASL